MQQLRTLKSWYGRNFANWDGLAGLDQDLVHMDNHLPNITFAGAVAAGTATAAVAGTKPGIAQLFEDGTYAVTSRNEASNLVAIAYAAKQGSLACDGATVLICTGSSWLNSAVVASAAAASAAAAAASANAMALSSASGVIGYATKALMDADIAHIDGTVAYVTNDAIAINNSIYRKTGALNAGSWVVQSATVYSSYAVAVEKTASTVAAATTKWAMPNRTYDLTDNIAETADVSGKVISYMTNKGTLRVPHVSSDALLPYPYQFYEDDFALAVVDKTGAVIDGLKKTQVSLTPLSFGKMWASVSESTGTVSAAWRHGANQMIKVIYKPNGFNGLFNWFSTSIATLGDPLTAAWTVIASSSSDSWPPLIVYAEASGDGGISNYTGGNHDVGGAPTARMVSLSISVDGRKILAGESFTAYVDEVKTAWKNELMAFNTVTLGRYVLAQEFTSLFKAGDVSGFCRITAYESIRVDGDNGPQMFPTGYETVHYYDGETQTRVILDNAAGSGLKATYPAWACVFASATNGYHGSWTDHAFEAGDGRYVLGSSGFYRNGNNGKFYSAIRAGAGSASSPIFAVGEGYEWHGGYFWSPVQTGLDSAFTIHKRGVPMLAHSFLGSGSARIAAPSWVQGREVDAVGVAGAGGIKTTAAAYKTSLNQIK